MLQSGLRGRLYQLGHGRDALVTRGRARPAAQHHRVIGKAAATEITGSARRKPDVNAQGVQPHVPRDEAGNVIVKVSKSTSAGSLAGSLCICLDAHPHLRLLYGLGHPTFTAAKALGLVNLMQNTKSGRSIFFIPKLVETNAPENQQGHSTLLSYHADVYCEDMTHEEIAGEITKVPDKAQDWRAYRKSRELNEERAHQMADVLYDTLQADNDAVVVASTHGEVTNGMHALALCNRRLVSEGGAYRLGCTVYMEGAVRKSAQQQGGLMLYVEKREVP